MVYQRNNYCNIFASIKNMTLSIIKEKVIIGRVGHGEVYYISNKPKIAYKQTHTECVELKKEYNNLNLAYLKYIEYTEYKLGIRNKAQILKPSNWEKNGFGCKFQLSRVKPVYGKYTTQAYIGETETPNMDKIIKIGDAIRGRYMGPNILKKYAKVEILAEMSGVLMAIVQYGAKLDGLDIELIIGKVDDKDTIKLYLIDFDQTNLWEDPTNEEERKTLIMNLSYALIAETYFPNINSKYHASFVKGYLEVAKFFDYLSLANEVIADMTDIY